MKKKLLWTGDVVAPTGFARVNENILPAFDPDEWDVHVLGINISGDYNPLQGRYKLYPAAIGAADRVGVERIRPLAEQIKPDLIVMHNDAWLIGSYLNELRGLRPQPKLIGYAPPDSPNQAYGSLLNDLDLLLCPTEFGTKTLTRGGYTGRSAVVPYGVDRSIFQPIDQAEARDTLGFPRDAIIFGRADRNAKRKRYDETIRLFHRYLAYVGSQRAEGMFLHLHCAPRDVGWDLPQLVEYYDLKGKVYFSGTDLIPSQMLPLSTMPAIFSAWTAHWSCTMGEGFGLVALESAACGAAQVLPRWSAYGEWMRDGAVFVDVERVLATDGGINTMGALVNDDSTMTALDDVVANHEECRQKALDVAADPRYDWERIRASFAEHVNEVMGAEAPKEEAA